MAYSFINRAIGRAALIGLAAAASACTMKSQEAPDLTGPSEFGQSVTVSVSPDVLPKDGGSQSVITVLVLGPNGEPMRNVSLRLEIHVGGTPMDFGSLSARNVVTNAEGRATAVYTAPAEPSLSVDNFTIVDIVASPIGSDFGNTTLRAAAIRLVPPGGVIPPDGLDPYFAFTPDAPAANQNVLFTACNLGSRLCSPPNNPIVSYEWDFDDGARANGRTVAHGFAEPGFYSVQLTITDAFGRAASETMLVEVEAGDAPTAAFSFSPTNPLPTQTVFFNASASRSAADRRIVSYAWDFGDGSTGSGVTPTHVYTTAGSYTVVLNVTDDAGRVGTISAEVSVGIDNPTAEFTFAPSSPLAGQIVAFNGNASTAVPGRTIVTFLWNFGDGTTTTGSAPSKAYAAPGTYNVTLTVVDSAGKSDSETKSIVVQ